MSTFFRQTLITTCLVVSLAFTSTTSVFAADEYGKFATKGAGLVTCGDMMQLSANNPEILQRFVGWASGYVSATNLTSDNTFDVLLFENAESVFQYIYERCSKHRNENFSVATGRVVELMRLTKIDRLTEYKRFHGASEYQYYSEVNELILAKLIGLGFLVPAGGNPTDEELIEAMKAFQKSKNLPVTGDADQRTLIEMLRKREGA